MNWSILGIEPTKDKEEIKKAYRKELIKVNPEDKPEEFKALRETYEEALSLADRGDKPEEEDHTPVGAWIKNVQAVYEDFERRIDPSAWKELFEDDVCVALDQKHLAEDKLLEYFLEHFFLPHNVWLVIEDTFSLMERKEELMEKWPPTFVEYIIIDGIRAEDPLPYDMFVPGKDGRVCDEYRRMYNEARRMPLAEAKEHLERLMELSEKHPYGRMFLCQYENVLGDKKKGMEGLLDLLAEYPKDLLIMLTCAIALAGQERWEEAEELADKVLEMDETQAAAVRIIAQCLEKKGKLIEAKERLYDYMDMESLDQTRAAEAIEEIRKINETLKVEFQERIDKNSDDMEAKRELAWCYLQDEEADQAAAICDTLKHTEEDAYDYHNLCAKAYFANAEYEKSICHQEEKVRLQKETVDDGSKKNKDRIKGIPDAIELLGSNLYHLGRREEAIKAYEEAVSIEPVDAAALSRAGAFMKGIKEYDRAIDILEKLVEQQPFEYTGYYLLGETLFDVRRDGKAYDAVSRALELNKADLAIYVLKMRILIKNHAFGEAHEILDFLKENDVDEMTPVKWCKGQLAELEKEDRVEALSIYKKVAEEIEQGEYVPWAPEVYFKLAVLEGDNLDLSDDKEAQRMLDLVEKGLTYDEYSQCCLDYKAWLLKYKERKQEAFETYKKMEEMPLHWLSCEQGLAEIYYEDIEHQAEQALKYYTILNEERESGDYLFYIGTCYRYLGRLEKAEAAFLREVEIEERPVDGYRGLAIIYGVQKEYDKALDAANHVIELEIGQQDKSNIYGYYGDKVTILCRMNRTDEAIETLKEMCRECNIDRAYGREVDVYCQGGRFLEAAKVLDDWQKVSDTYPEYIKRRLKVLVYTGNEREAYRLARKHKKHLAPEDYEEFMGIIWEFALDYKKLIGNWESRKKKKNGETSLELLHLSENYFHVGKKKKAVSCAQEALELLDAILDTEVVNAAVYRLRRAYALALLGRREEADEEIEKAKSMHMCEYCRYGNCKDAEYYKGRVAELFGEYDKAEECYEKGHENWPDEEDFIIGLRRVRGR